MNIEHIGFVNSCFHKTIQINWKTIIDVSLIKNVTTKSPSEHMLLVIRKSYLIYEQRHNVQDIHCPQLIDESIFDTHVENNVHQAKIFLDLMNQHK